MASLQRGQRRDLDAALICLADADALPGRRLARSSSTGQSGSRSFCPRPDREGPPILRLRRNFMSASMHQVVPLCLWLMSPLPWPRTGMFGSTIIWSGRRMSMTARSRSVICLLWSMMASCDQAVRGSVSGSRTLDAAAKMHVPAAFRLEGHGPDLGEQLRLGAQDVQDRRRVSAALSPATTVRWPKARDRRRRSRCRSHR